MNPVDKTSSAESGSLRFEFELNHSLEKVWRALTEPALLETWLLPVVDHQLSAGQQFTYIAPPQPGWDGLVSCRYLVIEPLRKLSYSWQVGEIDTIVTFELTPTDYGTQMTLIQSGFSSSQKRNLGGARYGWKQMGERLVELLDATNSSS